jgi:hypothetical protein
MTAEEYERAQARLGGYNERVIRAAETEFRAALQEAAEAVMATGTLDREALQAAFAGVITGRRDLTAERAESIANRYVADCMQAAGMKPDYAWEKRTSLAGAVFSGYYKTPEGVSVFVPAYRRADFLRKYHLSGETRPMQVWDIAGECAAEAEERIFTVIECGRALGRDVKDIGKDLEVFIHHRNGGARVIGRWGGMISPYVVKDGELVRSEKKIIMGWERAYIASMNERLDPLDAGYVFYGSREAREILDSPQAQAWLAGKRMANGKLRLPPGAKRYVARLGKAGLDYRAVRVLRTESAVAFNDRQARLAETNPAATGLVMRRLEADRDGWKCLCVEAARKCRDAGGWKPAEIEGRYRAPLHPNCGCRDEPLLLGIDAMMERIFQKYGV